MILSLKVKSKKSRKKNNNNNINVSREVAEEAQRGAERGRQGEVFVLEVREGRGGRLGYITCGGAWSCLTRGSSKDD